MLRLQHFVTFPFTDVDTQSFFEQMKYLCCKSENWRNVENMFEYYLEFWRRDSFLGDILDIEENWRKILKSEYYSVGGVLEKGELLVGIFFSSWNWRKIGGKS